MPDQFDQATDIEMAQRDEALRAALRPDRPQRHVDFDGENCVSCAMPIPAKRLEMKRVRCVECQEAIDRRARR